VKDRLRLYRRAGITTLQAKLDATGDPGSRHQRLDTLAQLLDLVDEVDAEPAAAPGEP
jgi:hypothetical protein